MRASFFIVSILSLVLMAGIFLAGCVQYTGSNHVQPGGTTGTPVQTPEQPTPEITRGQFGTNEQAGSPLGMLTSYNAGQNPAQSDSPEAGNIQRTYVVAMTEERQNPSTVLVTFQGGQDSAYLQYITVTADGAAAGEMHPPSGQSSLPVGTQEKFSAAQPGLIVATGHFSDGTDQVILDTLM
jgi:hypothetical protein